MFTKFHKRPQLHSIFIIWGERRHVDTPSCILGTWFLNSIVLEIVPFPIFLELIYVSYVSKLFSIFISSGGILSKPSALLDFNLLIIVHISLYFGDDTSEYSRQYGIISRNLVFWHPGTVYTTIVYIIFKTGWYAACVIKDLCFTFHYDHTMNPKILTGLLMYDKYLHRPLVNNFTLKMDKEMTYKLHQYSWHLTQNRTQNYRTRRVSHTHFFNLIYHIRTPRHSDNKWLSSYRRSSRKRRHIKFFVTHTFSLFRKLSSPNLLVII